MNKHFLIATLSYLAAASSLALLIGSLVTKQGPWVSMPLLACVFLFLFLFTHAFFKIDFDA